MPEPGGGMPRRLTYADYKALPDDGSRYQLIDGELVVNPSPNRWHQVVVGELYVQLRAFVDRQGLGQVYLAPLDVILDEHVVFQPDLLFVACAHGSILRDANVTGSPDLCVEVLSRGTERTDRIRKLPLYARHGVEHVWLVDVDARSIEEYVLAADVYRVRSVTGNDDTFRPAALPGFSFCLAPLGLPRLR